MNAVGIDVSKGKSMVAIMRPFGEIVSTPFEIKHTSSDINSLVKLIKSIEGESRIVMEHTGRYYEVLAHQLSEANLFVSAINPKLIKDFDNDSLRKVKTDKADSVKIARYALDKWQNLKQYSVMDELRNQLKTMNRQFGFYMKQKTAMKNNQMCIRDRHKAVSDLIPDDAVLPCCLSAVSYTHLPKYGNPPNLLSKILHSSLLNSILITSL